MHKKRNYTDDDIFGNNWATPPDVLTLQPGDVHIWCASSISTEFNVRQFYQILTLDEQERAKKLHFQKDRDRFIIARGLLRTILSRYISIAPESLHFHYTSSGKPSLISEQQGDTLRFNLSHSHHLILYAVTSHNDIGIDLEYIRSDFDWEKIANRFFSPNENTVLQRLPVDLRQTTFFVGWTRKEAYIKATGQGFAIPLDQFEVSLMPDEPPALLKTWNPQDGDRWFLYDLFPAPSYAAAMALSGPCSQLHCWNVPIGFGLEGKE